MPARRETLAPWLMPVTTFRRRKNERVSRQRRAGRQRLRGPHRLKILGRQSGSGLIVSGKDRGYVTVAQIDAVFRFLDAQRPGDLEPAFKLLRSMGVEVLHS